MDLDFQKRRRRERLYDKLHRGFVNTCMGITAACGLVIVYKMYEYYRYVRPVKLAQIKSSEDNLLLEGENLDESLKIDSPT